MPRGGARAGAGAPKKPSDRLKKPKQFLMDSATIVVLDRLCSALRVSASEVVRQAVIALDKSLGEGEL